MAVSTVALLGTLRELHTLLPDYGLGRLEEIVATKAPDLLCVEIDRRQWESGNLERAPLESKRALIQVSRSSAITLVPIGSGGSGWADSGIPLPCCGALAWLRRRLSQVLDGATVDLMKVAGGPRAINSPVVDHICGTLCELRNGVADAEGRRAWMESNEQLLDGIRWILQRDPGRRVLIAVDCRRKHWLRRRLQSLPEVALVDLWRF